jgi:hypothetical protein
MFVAVCAAALAKESWVAFPGFLVAHALIFGRTDDVAASRMRAALGGTVVLLASYLLFRRVLFGTVFGGLEGSGVSLQAGLFGEHVRAFLLRCFLPPGHVAATLWATGRDALIWPAAGILVALIVRGRALRVVLFTAVSTVVALVPVLPLTISISTPESERYIYVASIFSSMLLCWFVRGMFRWPPLAAAICLAAIVVHATALIRSNAFWHSNGVLTRTVVDSFAELALLHDPGGRSAIYLLNAPDNQEGRYVFRAGFYEAVPLLRPDVAARTSITICIATHAVRRAQDLVQVRRTGPRSFSVDFGNNGIIQPQIPSTATFRITAQTPTSYEVEFSEALGRATVLYFSDGRMHYAGTIGGGLR